MAELDRIQQDEKRRDFLTLSVDPSLPAEVPHQPDTAVSDHAGDASQLSQTTVVQVHRPTLQKLLAATASLVPASDDNPAFRVLEFRRGWLFGGNLDIAFWSETFFPDNFQLRLEKHTAQALASLLSLSSESHCTVEQTAAHALINCGALTIRLDIPDISYPAPIPEEIAAKPTAEVLLEASVLRHELKDLRGGAAQGRSDAVVRVLLVPGSSPGVRLEIYGPDTPTKRSSIQRSGRLAFSNLLRGETAGSVDKLDCAAFMDVVERALADFHGRIALSAAGSYLYITGQVATLPHSSGAAASRIQCTVRIKARPIPSPRLARDFIMRSFGTTDAASDKRKRLGKPRKHVALSAPAHTTD